jgi:hypothetical protein
VNEKAVGIGINIKLGMLKKSILAKQLIEFIESLCKLADAFFVRRRVLTSPYHYHEEAGLFYIETQ